MNRRLLLQRMIGGGMLIAAGKILHSYFFPSPFLSSEQQTFQYFLNILIPADETPSVVELGIDQKLFSLPEIKELLKHGIAWLETQSQHTFKQAFVNLKSEQIETILTLAEQAPFESLPYQFFAQVRYHAMQFYYADPRSRIGLVWEQLPQPNGFMDYQQSLKKAL